MAATSLQILLPIDPKLHGSLPSSFHLPVRRIPMACSGSIDPPTPSPTPFYTPQVPKKNSHVPHVSRDTSFVTSRVTLPAIPAHTPLLGTLKDKESTDSVKWASIRAEPLTQEAFAPFGDVIEALPEDAPVGKNDANVSLNRGTPRLYIMRLRNRPLKFERLTHHASVTQTLGAVGSNGEPWYLAVSAPTILKEGEDSGSLRSRSGHSFFPPPLSSVRVFRIESQQMVNLHTATWHQGPFFRTAAMDFYNLELSNTGEVDHTCHGFNGIKVNIIDE